MKDKSDEFFKYAKERHSVYIKKSSGFRPPWTKDPIIQVYKFTNVFRELDKTTVWFRENVRDPLKDKDEVLLATVIFRWFNRIGSGQAMFCQKQLNGKTAFENFLKTGDEQHLRDALIAYCGDGPYFTGAYMIRSPNDMTKLDGMLEMIRKFNEESAWKSQAKRYKDSWGKQNLESFWGWLKEFECQGPFHAYEVVTDLRHTKILDKATDIMTWANPGPGCKRGVSRMLDLGTRLTKTTQRIRPNTPTREQIDHVMKYLLARSRERKCWPSNWPKWEMREVEHTLCEWDKYERMRLGQGKMKGRYNADLYPQSR